MDELKTNFDIELQKKKTRFQAKIAELEQQIVQTIKFNEGLNQEKDTLKI